MNMIDVIITMLDSSVLIVGETETCRQLQNGPSHVHGVQTNVNLIGSLSSTFIFVQSSLFLAFFFSVLHSSLPHLHSRLDVHETLTVQLILRRPTATGQYES